MELSVTISGFYRTEGDFCKAVARAAELGFTTLDFPFGAAPFIDEGGDWEQEAHRIREEAERRGARFAYAHVPYNFPSGADEEEWARFDRRVKRSIKCCPILGVEWAAIHPHAGAAPGYDEEALFSHVTGQLLPFAMAAAEAGARLAVENMRDIIHRPNRRFCATAEQLVAVVDEVNGAAGCVGVCWDTGHANLSGLSQRAALKKVGKRLKMLHINDNYGQDDNHSAPFQGGVDWEGVARALAENGFEGALNFEPGDHAVRGEALQRAYYAYLAECGHTLAGMIKSFS